MLSSLLSGVFAIILGMLYTAGVFGPTEAEVATWGEIQIVLGAAILVLAAARRRRPSRVIRATLAFGLGTTAVLQILPAILWFAFHGTGISDGSPPATFVARWFYALPHIALALLASVSLRRGLLKDPASQMDNPTIAAEDHA